LPRVDPCRFVHRLRKTLIESFSGEKGFSKGRRMKEELKEIAECGMRIAEYGGGKLGEGN
jgi:hypothetical protein